MRHSFNSGWMKLTWWYHVQSLFYIARVASHWVWLGIVIADLVRLEFAGNVGGMSAYMHPVIKCGSWRYQKIKGLTRENPLAEGVTPKEFMSLNKSSKVWGTIADRGVRVFDVELWAVSGACNDGVKKSCEYLVDTWEKYVLLIDIVIVAERWLGIWWKCW